MTKARCSLTTVALITLISVISAGCGAAPASTGGSSSTAVGNNQALKFSGCMRDNGVSDFPDPDASGALTIDGLVNGTSLDTDSAVFKQALSACKDLQPAGFTGNKRTPEQQQLALDFAQCMRDNGIKDFPDPVPDGPIIDTSRMPGSPGALSIPGFREAQEECGHIVASLVSPGSR